MKKRRAKSAYEEHLEKEITRLLAEIAKRDETIASQRDEIFALRQKLDKAQNELDRLRDT